VACCYGGVVYTGTPTTFVIPVLDGSELGYNWTVAGPSHTVVEAADMKVVIVFNNNASYVISAAVWNKVSFAAVHLNVTSHGVGRQYYTLEHRQPPPVSTST